jgi:hypothetical protein
MNLGDLINDLTALHADPASPVVAETTNNPYHRRRVVGLGCSTRADTGDVTAVIIVEARSPDGGHQG